MDGLFTRICSLTLLSFVPHAEGWVMFLLSSLSCIITYIPRRIAYSDSAQFPIGQANMTGSILCANAEDTVSCGTASNLSSSQTDLVIELQSTRGSRTGRYSKGERVRKHSIIVHQTPSNYGEAQSSSPVSGSKSWTPHQGTPTAVLKQTPCGEPRATPTKRINRKS